jgi:hypothetical protein
MYSDQAQMCRRSHSLKNNMSKCNDADGMKYYRRGASGCNIFSTRLTNRPMKPFFICRLSAEMGSTSSKGDSTLTTHLFPSKRHTGTPARR